MCLYYTVLSLVLIRKPSHITSAAEGGGGFQMLTGERGRQGFADVSQNFEISNLTNVNL